jgi:RNA polymerase sigma-70 factor (ECF subfamily)
MTESITIDQAMPALAPPDTMAGGEQPEDAALMSRYATGDAQAFNILYGRYRNKLYRYLVHQCRDRTAADDVFQEVWDRVIRSAERYKPTAKFSTWLFHIAHNCLVDHYRQNGRRATHLQSIDDHADELIDSQPQPEQQASDAELAIALRRALQSLPTEQREAFVLHEEGLNLDELAEVTATGVETAKSRLRYAVTKLRGALKGLRRDLEASP